MTRTHAAAVLTALALAACAPGAPDPAPTTSTPAGTPAPGLLLPLVIIRDEAMWRRLSPPAETAYRKLIKDMLNDVWDDRDLPVLREVARRADQQPRGLRVHLTEIADGTGLGKQDVERAAFALLDAGLVEIDERGDSVVAFTGITPQARERVGLWPTAEPTAEPAADPLVAVREHSPRDRGPNPGSETELVMQHASDPTVRVHAGSGSVQRRRPRGQRRRRGRLGQSPTYPGRTRRRARELSASDVDTQLREVSKEHRDFYGRSIVAGAILYVTVVGSITFYSLLTNTFKDIKWGLPLDAETAVVGCFASLAIVAALAVAHASTLTPSNDSRPGEVVSHYVSDYVWRRNTTVIAMILGWGSLTVAFGLIPSSPLGAAAGLILSAVSLGLTASMFQRSRPEFLRVLVRRRIMHIDSQLKKLRGSVKTNGSRPIACLRVAWIIGFMLLPPLLSSVAFMLATVVQGNSLPAALEELCTYLADVLPPAFLLGNFGLFALALGKATTTTISGAGARIIYVAAGVVITLAVANVATVSFVAEWAEWRVAAVAAGIIWMVALAIPYIVTWLRKGPFYEWAANREIRSLEQEREARKLELKTYR